MDSGVRNKVPEIPPDRGLNVVNQRCRKSSRSAAQVFRSISSSLLLPESLGLPDLSFYFEAVNTSISKDVPD